MATVREVSLDLFRAHGLTTVFGNPGSTELPMLANFPDDFDYVLGLQEAAVVGLADGYAQATGGPALVNLHTAPGVGNAMGALVTAAANKTPLVVTAGQQVRPMLTLEAMLTHPRAAEVPLPVVSFSAEPGRARDVPAVLARAVHRALTPPRGPVFVSVPMDDWEVEWEAEDAADADLLIARRVHGRTAPDPAGLGPVVDALDAARSPALVVGAGVDVAGGHEDAVALADRLGAAVYSAPAAGRLGFPTTHPRYRGSLPQAIAPVARTLAEHDEVLVVGAPVFRYYPYVPGRFLAEGTRLWQITDDPDEAARAPMGDAVLGDPALALRALLDRLPERAVAPARRTPPADPTPGRDGRLSGDEVFAVLAGLWPDDGVLVEESPSNRASAQGRVPLTRPGSFYFTASGGLGFGLPAAIGVALADPSRPVVAALGDGSLQYCVQALATAAARRAPVTVLVLDNREYAILKWFAAREDAPKAPGLDLPPVDHVGLAAAYGVPGESVTTADELAAALRRGLADDGPRLVHVPIAPHADSRPDA